MHALLLSCLLSVGQAERSPPGIDWSPVKAPLDRMATSVEHALGQVGKLKEDVLQAIHWSAVGAAVLLTVLAMHTLHLHGLAASKSNLTPAEKRP